MLSVPALPHGSRLTFTPGQAISAHAVRSILSCPIGSTRHCPIPTLLSVSRCVPGPGLLPRFARSVTVLASFSAHADCSHHADIYGFRALATHRAMLSAHAGKPLPASSTVRTAVSLLVGWTAHARTTHPAAFYGFALVSRSRDGYGFTQAEPVLALFTIHALASLPATDTVHAPTNTPCRSCGSLSDFNPCR